LFHNLEKSLFENYSINLREDIQSFSQIINDFKVHGYDAIEIIKEYLKSLSIKLDIKTNEEYIKTLQIQKSKLIEKVSSLDSQIGQHKITLDNFSHLESMGFGLKELRQLWDMILEITQANNISYHEAVSKFLKDVKEQYDKKLGFEPDIKEKEKELVQIKNQLYKERLALQLQPHIVPTLQHLFQKGVSEEDIINMNYLVTKLVTSPSFDIIKNDSLDNYPNNKNKTSIWKSLTEKLEKIQDINLEIEKQQKNYIKIQQEINELNT
jgi:hypothetical protein